MQSRAPVWHTAFLALFVLATPAVAVADTIGAGTFTWNFGGLVPMHISSGSGPGGTWSTVGTRTSYDQLGAPYQTAPPLPGTTASATHTDVAGSLGFRAVSADPGWVAWASGELGGYFEFATAPTFGPISLAYDFDGTTDSVDLPSGHSKIQFNVQIGVEFCRPFLQPTACRPVYDYYANTQVFKTVTGTAGLDERGTRAIALGGGPFLVPDGVSWEDNLSFGHPFWRVFFDIGGFVSHQPGSAPPPPPPTGVPEPSTLLLMAAGALGAARSLRRRE